MRGIIRATLAAVLVAILALSSLSPAHAEDPMADSYLVTGSVAENGQLSIKETITFSTSQAPPKLTQRLATKRESAGAAYFVYEISDLSATAGTTDLAPTITEDGDYLVIEIDTAQAGAEPITISYSVVGAAHEGPELTSATGQTFSNTAVEWRVLQGLSVGVQRAEGTIDTPGVTSEVSCRAGAPDATMPCTYSQSGTHDAPQPSFYNEALGAGQVVVFTFGIDAAMVTPNEIVEQHWTLDRAFSTAPVPLLIALAGLIIGGAVLWLLHRAAGRDPDDVREPIKVATFVPVGEGESVFKVLADIRPGQVGTVVDERVDPVDVTATLLDLAVRGHVRIIELARTTIHQPLDWTFERREGNDALDPYERDLLDAIAPIGGPAVPVSEMAATVDVVAGQVQDDLYDEVVQKGWFARRPDSTRSSWQLAGVSAMVVAVVALVVLVAFTRFGLLGIALVALAAGLIVVGREMPQRTHAGAAMLKGLDVLTMQLQSQDTDQMPAGRELAELSKVLPYALVLGVKARWLQAMVDADPDDTADGTDLDWYHAPDTWHLANLPESLRAFIVSVQGSLYGR